MLFQVISIIERKNITINTRANHVAFLPILFNESGELLNKCHVQGMNENRVIITQQRNRNVSMMLRNDIFFWLLVY